MSQANQDNPRPSNPCGVYNRPKFKRGMDHENLRYRAPYHNFQYYNTNYNFHRHWNYRKKRPDQRQRRQLQQRKRSPSPFSGTEEYNKKKIQEASDMIKRKLMMPETDDHVNINIPESERSLDKEELETETITDKSNDKGLVRNKKVSFNVEEIQHKILTHITKLSHGKKVNLICSNPSGYDVVIEQIHKQKRLELSKALRDMCSNQGVENSEVINSIIPDIGIKIEDLPLEVIRELSSTLDWKFDDALYSQNNETANAINEVSENDLVTPVIDQEVTSVHLDEFDVEIKNDTPLSTQIKQEILDIKPNKEIFDIDPDQNDASYSQNKEPVFVKNKVSENDLVIPVIDQEITGVQLEITDEPPQIKQEVLDIKLDEEILDTEPDQELKTEINDHMETSVCNLDQEIKEETLNVIKEETQNGKNESLLNAEVSLGSQNVDTAQKKFTNSVGSQTDACIFNTNSIGIQTGEDAGQFNVDTDNVQNLDDAIQSMLAIDREITRLTTMRQDLFTKLQKKQSESREHTRSKNSSPKRKKCNSFDQSLNEVAPPINDNCNVLIQEDDAFYDKVLNFRPILEKILVVKVIKDTVLAASEKGRIFYINTLDGSLLSTLEVTNAPIISLRHWSAKQRNLHLIVGSCDRIMHEFHYDTKKLLRLTKIKDLMQCMEVAWDHIFIGATNGNLLRYSLKRCKIEFRENIALDSVMVLKATQEGARRVLLVGMRNSPITVRDAMSGLHLRTMTDLVTPTVYSLLLEKSMVYCGTTFHDILVFGFHDGSLVHKHQATNSRGVSCMKIVGNLLFASCYNGNIYVYNIKIHEYVGFIEGPGGVILSMEVFKNIIIVGTMSLKFASILIPDYILELNRNIT